MSKRSTSGVEELLVEASQSVVSIDTDEEPWVHGWFVESYRRSGQATLPSPTGSVTIAGSGLDRYEEAVGRLLREKAVRHRWDAEEIWGLVATLVAAAASAEDCLAFVTSNVARIREAKPSLVVMPMANVTWTSSPLAIAGGTVGVLNEELVSAVAAAASDRPDLSGAPAADWIDQQLRPSTPDGNPTSVRDLVVAARWTPAQRMFATDVSRRWLEDLCCAALLLSLDPPTG